MWKKIFNRAFWIKIGRAALKRLPFDYVADLCADAYDIFAGMTKNTVDDRFGKKIFRPFLHDAAVYAKDQSNKARDDFFYMNLIRMLDFCSNEVLFKVHEAFIKILHNKGITIPRLDHRVEIKYINSKEK